MAEGWNDPLSNPSAGMFSNMLQGSSDFANNNKEMVPIFLDMLGKGFAPKNPFAGIGTTLGQSSIANKARQEQAGTQKSFIDQLMSLGGLTGPEEPGFNKITHGMSKDGIPETTVTLNPGTSKLDAPTVQTPTIQTPTVGAQPITTQSPTVAPQYVNSAMGVYPF